MAENVQQYPNTSGPYRVLLTDVDYKHSIALAQYIKRVMPEALVLGHNIAQSRFARHYRCFDELVTGRSLADVLRTASFDQVIPVSGAAVTEVARTCPERAVVSSPEQLQLCFDKGKSLELCEQANVPAPTTQRLRSEDDLREGDLTFPCVVKAGHEISPVKTVFYCHNVAETRAVVRDMLGKLQPFGIEVLVQEFIQGTGHGFFALTDHGSPKRIFMHERLREDPPTGGVSTAARAYYSERLEELGIKLLSAIGWNGIAMVEFKFDTRRQDFVLMEINGKFWGSSELALRAGVNFGYDLIRLHRGEALAYSREYDHNTKFYWPLDGDLKTLWRTRNVWRGVKDYFQPGAATNVGQSWIGDAMKVIRLGRDILREPRR